MMGGSRENGRWKKDLKFTSRALVDEKAVEKVIAADCGGCWVNQIPPASGFLDKTSETHCNIDLVKRTAENTYEFIELKYDDATPLFGAFEILKYALLLLVSRERLEDFKYSHERNPLIWANAVKLIVLAPSDYYAPYSLRSLEGSCIRHWHCCRRRKWLSNLRSKRCRGLTEIARLRSACGAAFTRIEHR